MTLSNFQELGLSPALIEAVARLEYQEPTPIQARIIPSMLAGEDVIGQAQTGTGKTAAFALPILQNLGPEAGVQALVVAPTRELALQVNEAFEALGGDVPTVTIYGGQPYPIQVKALRRGARVVVGTPGRLLDLMQQQVLRLDGVRTVVLDEADEMLSMGFLDEVETILAALPEQRQTALFSATLPDEIRNLAGKYLRSPVSVSIAPSQPAVATIEQRCYVVNEQDKVAALTRIFEVEAITSALIFARTRARTATLANELMSRGYPAEVLNGDLSQEAREQVLERFKAEKIKVLVATDIAARGLDIDHLTHVFNFDLPQQPESYVHRIGRTGRAGRTGIAIALLTPREERLLRRIESYTKQKAQRCEVPSREEIMAHRDRQVIEG
ncbi:MAG: DEAD/DEAH box helicase, partial [Candidatus Eremiobacteraeota bacterium]|nr:DEAD/DEAH box helicase [Candidatus Eremiobacteraeota bacterium]